MIETRGLIQNVVHYPNLKTILAIEEVLKNAGAALSRNQILARLPKMTMRSTLNLTLNYMENRGMVLETKNGFIWTFNSNKKLEEAEKEELNLELSDEKSDSRYIKHQSDSVKDNAERIKSLILPILKNRGVSHAAIFGSTARGDETKKSDVDLLVEFKNRKITLFDLGGLKVDLEEKLKRKVDVVEFRSVDKRLKRGIFHDKVDIL